MSILSATFSILVIKTSGLAGFSFLQLLYIFFFLGTVISNNSVSAVLAEIAAAAGQLPLSRKLIVDALIISAILNAASSLISIGAIFGWSYFTGTAMTSGWTLIYATSFAYLCQDQIRRLLVLTDNHFTAIVSDSISYLGQASVLGVLFTQSMQVEISIVLWVIMLTSALGCLPVLWLFPTYSQRRFAVSRPELVSRVADKFHYLVPSGFAKFFASQNVLIFSSVALSVEAFGTIKAIQVIYKPINILLLAYESYLPKIFISLDEIEKRNRIATIVSLAATCGIAFITILAAVNTSLVSRLIEVPSVQLLGPIILWSAIYISMSLSLALRSLLRAAGSDQLILRGAIASAFISLSLWPCIRFTDWNVSKILVTMLCIQIPTIIYYAIALKRK